MLTIYKNGILRIRGLPRYGLHAEIRQNLYVHNFGTKRMSSTPAQKSVMNPNDLQFKGEEGPKRSCIPLLSSKSLVTVVDTIDQTKIGGNPDKYDSYWRDQHRDESVIRVRCLLTTQNLVHYSKPDDWEGVFR